MNLYEALGVAKDATTAQIRSAFRRKASKAHPDRAGGDAHTQALLNKAYKVLTDPQKRAHYDETGAEMPLDNMEQRVNALLMDAFGQVYDLLAASSDEMSVHVRAIPEVRGMLKSVGQKATAEQKKLEKTLTRAEAASKRIQRKTPSDMDPWLAVHDNRVRLLKHKIKQAQEALETAECALKRLDEYREMV